MPSAQQVFDCCLAGSETVVQEYVLSPDGSSWSVTRERISIGEKNVFAPANLRAAADNLAYKQLVHGWMDAKHTLRYSGGMVSSLAAGFDSQSHSSCQSCCNGPAAELPVCCHRCRMSTIF